MADFPLLRIAAEAMPGLLEGGIVRAKVQAVLRPNKGKAVAGGVTRVLEVVLTELLCWGHVQRAGVYIGNLVYGVVEQLTAGMGSEQLIPFRQLQMADERVLQLADDGVRLMVLQSCPKPQLPVFRPNPQVKGKGFFAQGGVVYSDGVFFHTYLRSSVGCSDFYFFLFRRVVIQTPETAVAGVIVPVHIPAQEHEVTGSVVDGGAEAFLDNAGLVEEYGVLAGLRRCRGAGDRQHCR